MSSFIQEPDMRTLVAITDCVHAIRQSEVKSCAALYAVGNSEAAQLFPSSAVKRIGVAHATDKRPEKENLFDRNAQPNYGDTTKNKVSLSRTEAASRASSSSSLMRFRERDGNRCPQDWRSEKGNPKAQPRPLSPPPRAVRTAEDQTKVNATAKGATRGDDVTEEVSVIETSWHPSWLGEHRPDSMRRDHDDRNSFPRHHSAVVDSVLAEERGQERYKQREENATRKEGESRLRQLNIAPLPPSAESQAKKLAPTTTTTTTFTTSNSKQNALKYSETVRSKSSTGDSHHGAAHHSSYSTINLSEVKPQSFASFARTESRPTEHYSYNSDKAAYHTSRPSSPSSEPRPVSPPERFQRETAAHPGIPRASRSHDASASLTEMWSFNSLKKERERRTCDSTVAHQESSHRDRTREDVRRRDLNNNSTRDHTRLASQNAGMPAAATTSMNTAPTVSASPVAVTAAAAARVEGSVDSHNTMTSRPSARSITYSMSDQNSPVPIKPFPRTAAASTSVESAYAQHYLAESTVPNDRERSDGTTLRSASSMRRDHHHSHDHNGDDNKKQHLRSQGGSSVGSSRHSAAQAAARFVLDTRRRLSPERGEDAGSTRTAPSQRSAASSTNIQSDRDRPSFFHKAQGDNGAWTTTPSASPDAEPSHHTETTPTRSPSSRARYSNATAAGLGLAPGQGDLSSRYLAYVPTATPVTRAAVAAASRDAPRLASPPLKPHHSLSLSISPAAPRLLPGEVPSHEVADHPPHTTHPMEHRDRSLPGARHRDSGNYQDGSVVPNEREDYEGGEDSAALLRAAIRRMQQASSAAADASAAPTQITTSATADRYALLVESARLLSSSVLVFTALAPGDRHASTSATRSASVVYNTAAIATPSTPSPTPWHPTSRRAVPFSFEEELLAETAMRVRAASRDSRERRASLSPISPQPVSLNTDVDMRRAGRSSSESASGAEVDVRRSSEARRSSEGERSSLEKRATRQTMRRSTAPESVPRSTRESVASHHGASSGSGSVKGAPSSGVDPSTRRRVVPAPDVYFEPSPVKQRSSVASSNHARSAAPSAKLSEPHGAAGVVEVEKSKEGMWGRGNSSGEGETDQEVSLKRRSASAAERRDDQRSCSSRAHSGSSRHTATLKPAPLSATQLFREHHSGETMDDDAPIKNAESSEACQPREEEEETEERQELPPWPDAQRRYYNYVSPTKQAQRERNTKVNGTDASSGRRALRDSPHASLASVSPLTPPPPPPLASPDYRNSPCHSHDAVHACQHCKSPREATRRELDTQTDGLAQQGQPVASEHSPHHRKLDLSPLPKKPTSVFNVLQRPAVAHAAEVEANRSGKVCPDISGNDKRQPKEQGQYWNESEAAASVPQLVAGNLRSRNASGWLEKKVNQDQQFSDAYTHQNTGQVTEKDFFDTIPSDENNKEESEEAAAHRPQRARAHHHHHEHTHTNQDISNAASLILNYSASFSHRLPTHQRSIDSTGSGFEWVAEDYAAAQQRYATHHGEDGGSPLSIPSASESRASFGQMPMHHLNPHHSSSSSANHLPWNRSGGGGGGSGAGLVNSSLSVEGLSNSEFSSAGPQRQRRPQQQHLLTSPDALSPTSPLSPPEAPSHAAGAGQVHHQQHQHQQSAATSLHLQSADFSHPPDSSDRLNLHHPSAHQAAPSFSFTGSFTSMGVQSTYSAERTPTAPSMAMNAAVMEASSNEWQIPHAAALFSDPLGASTMSITVGPSIEEKGGNKVKERNGGSAVDGQQQQKIYSIERDDNVTGDASGTGGQEEVLWVDESGHYFTQPQLIEDGEDVLRESTVVTSQERFNTAGEDDESAEKRGSDQPESQRDAAASVRHSGGSAAGSARSSPESNGTSDAVNAAPRPSRQSTLLHHHALGTRSDSNFNAQPPPDPLSTTAEYPTNPTQQNEKPGRNGRREHEQQVFLEEQGGEADDVPPLRSGYTASPAPIIAARGSQHSTNSSTRHTSHSRGRSTMSSASTSPERPERGQEQEQEELHRGEMRRSAHSSVAGDMDGDECEYSEERVRHRRATASASPPPTRGTLRGRDLNTAADTAATDAVSSVAHLQVVNGWNDEGETCGYVNEPSLERHEGSTSRSRRRSARHTSEESSQGRSARNTEKQSFPSADEAAAHRGDGEHPLKSAVPLSEQQTLPSPVPSAQSAGSRARLALPAALSKPPMVPTSGRPRLAEATVGQRTPLISPAPASAAAPVRVGLTREQWGYGVLSHANADDADFFGDEEDDEEGYCSYGYGEEDMDV